MATKAATLASQPAYSGLTDAAAVRTALVGEVLARVGPIRHSTTRDIEMVRYLAGVRGGGDLRPKPGSDTPPTLPK